MLVTHSALVSDEPILRTTAVTRAADVISWTGLGSRFDVAIYRVGTMLPLVVRIMARDGRARATGLSSLVTVP